MTWSKFADSFGRNAVAFLAFVLLLAAALWAQMPVVQEFWLCFIGIIVIGLNFGLNFIDALHRRTTWADIWYSLAFLVIAFFRLIFLAGSL